MSDADLRRFALGNRLIEKHAQMRASRILAPAVGTPEAAGAA